LLCPRKPGAIPKADRRSQPSLRRIDAGLYRHPLSPSGTMRLPIQLIATDFDGTLHAEHEDPPIPQDLEALLGHLQRRGAKWVINTGRDLSSLLEGLARAYLAIMPDYVVVVEREIYRHENSRFVADDAWNRDCRHAHEELFRMVRADVPGLVAWINERFVATIYEDAYSPFCLMANHNHDADAILEYLEAYCRQVPNLTIMRNDVYARFSHAAYNKGTALGEIARQLAVSSDEVLAAGDHFNDLPMLSNQFARRLIAPANAIPAVKEAVQRQNGYVSHQPWGHGVARGLEYFLEGVDLG
jgi:HAD superfamily hydrolase (TIGR01484 family)